MLNNRLNQLTQWAKSHPLRTIGGVLAPVVLGLGATSSKVNPYAMSEFGDQSSLVCASKKKTPAGEQLIGSGAGISREQAKLFFNGNKSSLLPLGVDDKDGYYPTVICQLSNGQGEKRYFKNPLVPVVPSTEIQRFNNTPLTPIKNPLFAPRRTFKI